MRKDRKDDSYVPDMPPVTADYLLGYFYEIGPTIVGAMGEGPLTHGELAAWQAGVGLKLAPWEVRFLRRLSIEYLNQSQKAEKADCLSPWDADAERRDLGEVARSMKASIEELAQL